MKHFMACLLALALLSGFCFATGGDPNIDGGGGDMGDGSQDSYWVPGDDGVRVTILRGSDPTITFDLANKDYGRTVTQSFEVNCKLSYLSGVALHPAGIYKNRVPPVALPTIVSKNGGSTIAGIKSYFTDEQPIRYIAEKANLTFEELTNGSYRLLIEPITYFKYKGIMYAMTATEAALYDNIVNGDLKLWMGTLTHQNQPFSMFLERSDLGIAPWLGGTTGKQDNSTIKHQLGVGIVSFKYSEEQEPEGPDLLPDPSEPETPGGEPTPPPDPSDYNFTYRTDTDVITSVLVRPSRDITPDDNAYVTFTILGQTYSRQYVCPGGSSQLVWVRWHTPTTPQAINIQVSGPGVSGTIPVTVGDVPENIPPNPVYDGPNIGAGQYQPNFRLSPEPDWGKQTTATWREWYPTWHPPRRVPDGRGGWITYPGYWSFSIVEYGASLAVSYDLTPSTRNPTAAGRNGQYTVKSGYGVVAKCSVRVVGIGGATNNDITTAQNAIAVFPDWKFQSYNRLLEPESRGSYNTEWRFKENPYSYYKDRAHFIPVWYPSGTKYPIPMAVFDVWTPAGQLYASASDYVDVSGDMYDDWYIRVID